MIYRIVHRTTYNYRYPVSVGTHVACLKPRALPRHQLSRSELRIQPRPATRTERVDFFGNILCFFTIREPHKELVVEARSEVMMDGNAAPWPQLPLPWEEAAKSVPNDHSPAGLEAYQFGFESPRIRVRPEFASYALQSFTHGRPMPEALLDLTTRIHKDFRFDSKVTNVRTPTEEVFKKRRGVCQDFAHLQIACLRSLNLAARYVSGYLRTMPPAGRPRLVGADASHAWCAVWAGAMGWVDFDPTNDCVPSDGHITVAWGRDYSDVSPIHGVLIGGARHTLDAGVDVIPIQ